MGPEVESPYLRSDEAAAYLRYRSKCGADLINRLAREGRIRFQRRGRTYLFTKDQLDDFVAMEATRR